MQRRAFLRHACSLALAPASMSFFAFHCQAAPKDVTAKIVDSARGYEKLTDWAPDYNFGGDKRYYCNEFVAAVLRAAGGATWEPIKRPTLFPQYREPLADEWSDPDFVIKGWKVIYSPKKAGSYKEYADILNLREPGDVVSGRGHVGIILDEKNNIDDRDGNDVSARHYYAISASAKTGAVEKNAWSSRIPDISKYTNPIQHKKDALAAVARYTVRRFVGV